MIRVLAAIAVAATLYAAVYVAAWHG